MSLRFYDYKSRCQIYTNTNTNNSLLVNILLKEQRTKSEQVMSRDTSFLIHHKICSYIQIKEQKNPIRYSEMAQRNKNDSLNITN